MKTLILVRHAQAVDRSPVITDHDRPLTAKWIKQSRRLTKLLRKLDVEPDYVISSTANRCHDTAKQICKKFDLKLHSDENLFLKGIDPYFEHIINTTDDIQTLVLVWHNNDLTDLISQLLTCNFPLVAKWSATIIKFDIKSWTEVKKSEGKLKCYITT